MNDHVQAIYQNGILRPLTPLDLPENSVVEIDVHDTLGAQKERPINTEKIKAFAEWMASLDPNTPTLTDEQISRETIYEEQILRQI